MSARQEGQLSLAELRRKHDTYDANLWKVLRALYEGFRHGKDRQLSHMLFPPNINEPKDVYEQRLARSFYINYSGEILDFIVSGLGQDPVRCALSDDGSVEPPEWYEDFMKDVSPIGGRRMSLQKLIRNRILSALIFRRAWTQIDLPRQTDAENQADQEAQGALGAYAIPLEPETVYDWQTDECDELVWAKTCTQNNFRSGPAANPYAVSEVYTVWTREAWVRYVVDYDKRKPPKETEMHSIAEMGTHSFGRVPLVRLELDHGMWAMNKLHGPALEHYNKRCALSWAEYKSLYQERYEFLAPPDPLASGPAIAENEERAVDQTHGIGWTQVRAKGDEVKFVGPD
ncbi:MAG: hypothetical protein ACRDBH_12320, partial [Bosea sp. (in: a-proteobacteria)]